MYTELQLKQNKKFNKIFIIILFFICYFLLANLKNNIYANTELNLHSNNAIIIDYNTQNVLYEKNGHEKVYPASTTKILTAILALEKLDLNKTITVSDNSIDSTPYGSSIMYLKKGEQITIRDLLYGLMIPSGNDAANVLAEEISGNIDAFIGLMNEKLKEIGCNDTHFTNPHGFHDDNHYTTPYDMTKLMAYAMKNETFRQIVETQYAELPATNLSDAKTFRNTNRLINPVYTQSYYKYALGGKTGYTDEARGTFVGYAKKDDKMLIVATFNGSQNISGLQARFLDSVTLFEYCFNNFNTETLLEKENFKITVADEKKFNNITASIENDIIQLVKNNEFEMTYDINIDTNKLNYINVQNSSQEIGYVTFNFKNEEQNISTTQKLLTEHVELIKNYKYYLNKINTNFNKVILFECILLLTLVFLFIITSNLMNSKKRKKSKKYNKNNIQHNYRNRIKF